MQGKDCGIGVRKFQMELRARHSKHDVRISRMIFKVADYC
jgi:hypothetical protein